MSKGIGSMLGKYGRACQGSPSCPNVGMVYFGNAWVCPVHASEETTDKYRVKSFFSNAKRNSPSMTGVPKGGEAHRRR